MSKPFIVLGAGASYDYSPTLLPGEVAPLTKDLIDGKYISQRFLGNNPRASQLLSDIIPQVKLQGKTFEDALTEIRTKTLGSKVMRGHFLAFEDYLKALFTDVSTSLDRQQQIKGPNNYRSLKNRLDTYTQGKACIATFNYDSLFEKNCGINASSITEYISGNIKLIKLHGSHDWSYVDHSGRLHIDNRNELYEHFPDIVENMKNIGAEAYHDMETHHLGEAVQQFPAIAIPLVGKDSYLCPGTHIEVLKTELKTVDRVLIIGWRAADPKLLDTMKENLPINCSVLVVSGSSDGASQIASTVSKATGLTNIEVFGAGFSGFIGSNESYTFFE